jgi:hypothetical protein
MVRTCPGLSGGKPANSRLSCGGLSYSIRCSANGTHGSESLTSYSRLSSGHGDVPRN